MPKFIPIDFSNFSPYPLSLILHLCKVFPNSINFPMRVPVFHDTKCNWFVPSLLVVLFPSYDTLELTRSWQLV